VLFVINPETRAHQATVRLPFAVDTTDVISGDLFAGETELRVPMAAQTCRMLRIDRAARPDAAVVGGSVMGEAG